MSDELKYTPPPWLLDIVLREVRPVAEIAARAKGVAYQNRERLIELCGQTGKNGELGHLRTEMQRMARCIAALEAMNADQAAKLVAFDTEKRAEKRMHARAGAIGSAGGATIVVGVVEALRLLLGG